VLYLQATEGGDRTVITRAEIETVLQGRWQILYEAYRVRRIGIFGSRARGDDTPVSDVDILVELEGPVGWEIVVTDL
jgi:predicted nucleotidyltransferase